jgi:hypothetical protein
MRKSIECKVTHSNVGRSREDGTFIKCKPVGVMEIGHDLLNYPNSIPLTPAFIPSNQSRKYHCQCRVRQRTR